LHPEIKVVAKTSTAAPKKGFKKKTKKAKKGKGKTKEGPESTKIVVEPTEVVLKFEELYDSYQLYWGKREESMDLITHHWDSDKLKAEVKPSVEKSLVSSVDDMLNLELMNLRMIMGLKVKTKKKGKKKKGSKKKQKRKKGPKLPGAKWCKNMEEYDMLIELVKQNVVKKLPP
jgi:hypothetical protein